MSKQQKQQLRDPFHEVVRSALKKFHDPKWLGKHSPLATVYFLGSRFDDGINSSEAERGRILQQLLTEASADLWSGALPADRDELEQTVNSERAELGKNSNSYYYYLLELRFFRHYFEPNTHPAKVTVLPDYVNVSRSRFFIHLDEAISAISKRLLAHFQPTVLLERPTAPDLIIGRETEIRSIQTALAKRSTIFLSGTGGVGKTTLGGALAAAWKRDAFFWFTIRIGLNDQLESVLFALAHFLHQHNGSKLWQYLLAENGEISDRGQAIGHLRHDLAATADQNLLICFDEVDRLVTDEEQPRYTDHAPIIELLEMLCDALPILLIGQRPTIDTDVHIHLEGLTPQQTASLLTKNGIKLSNEQIARLHAYTRGLPRLLRVYIALNQSGDDVLDGWQSVKQWTLTPIFERLWRRLSAAEQQILALLSVFRTAVPVDLFDSERKPFDSLLMRGLIEQNGKGGVSALPFVQHRLYHDYLSPEERDQLHEQAATVRANWGDYTAAAWHLVQKKAYQQAVELWYEHDENEIENGQSGAAKEMFLPISPQWINDPQARKKLKLIQNRLYRFANQFGKISNEKDLKGLGEKDTLFSTLLGETAYQQYINGNQERALELYEQSLNIFTENIHAITHIHRVRSRIYIDQHQLKNAEREALRAECLVKTIKATIASSRAQYEEAIAIMKSALEIALHIDSMESIAYAHTQIAIFAAEAGQLEQAHHHTNNATIYYEKIGNESNIEGLRANLAIAYINAENYDEGIELAESALQFFEERNSYQWTVNLCTNLGWAYNEVDELEKAREYALRVIATEELLCLPYAYYTLGMVHLKTGNVDHARTSFEAGLQMAEKGEDADVLAYLQQGMAQLN